MFKNEDRFSSLLEESINSLLHRAEKARRDWESYLKLHQRLEWLTNKKLLKETLEEGLVCVRSDDGTVETALACSVEHLKDKCLIKVLVSPRGLLSHQELHDLLERLSPWIYGSARAELLRRIETTRTDSSFILPKMFSFQSVGQIVLILNHYDLPTQTLDVVTPVFSDPSLQRFASFRENFHRHLRNTLHF